MNRATDDSRADRGSRQPAPAGPGRSAPRRAGGESTFFHLYKSGQGAYLRWGTAAAAAVVFIGFAIFLQEQLARWQNQWIEYMIPAVLLAVLAYLTFRALGQNRGVVDFMIATEGEMKKVNWSTRREVLGATKVVIATVIAMGCTLFIVNVIFMFVFESIGVLRIGMLKQIFGGGE